MMIAKPRMGTDPEFFLLKNGKPYPAHEILPNIKENAGKSFTSYVLGFDNFAVEANIEPSSCLQVLSGRHGSVLCDPKIAFFTKCFDPIIFLEKEHLKLPILKEFGCEPSLICRDKKIYRHEPLNDPDIPVRSAGFHIHLGMPDEQSHKTYTLAGGKYDWTPFQEAYSDENLKKAKKLLFSEAGQLKLIQLMDLLVGLPSVLMERHPESEGRRKGLNYGMAGEFRSQKHGFEYRTLSSWPMSSPIWMWWALASARDAFYLAFSDIKLFELFDMVEIAEIIDSSNLNAARSLWKKIRKVTFEEAMTIESCNVYNQKEYLNFLEKIFKSKEGYKIKGVTFPDQNLYRRGWVTHKHCIDNPYMKRLCRK